MKKKEILIGMRFGKLTVISKAESIPGGITVKRFWGAWNCLCDCGNKKIVKTAHLNKGQVTSCGCAYFKYKAGDKFNRLTLVSPDKDKWICLCDCGKEVKVDISNITIGGTKSCGCYNLENITKRAHVLSDAKRKYTPIMASARRVWKRYKYSDHNMDIEFDDFLKISQMNCVYCGTAPNKSFNNFEKEDGLFFYNGLDRIDSSKSHTLDNVLPCCYLCNRAKSDRDINDFLQWIKNINIPESINLNIPSSYIPNNSYLLSSANCIFYNYKQDSDITFEEFYYLSQQNCFYCNNKTTNICNSSKSCKRSSQKAKENGDFKYNGLDRIDSSKNHNKDNVVPCCKYCNFAKGKLTLEEFKEWTIRIKTYQEGKESKLK